MNYLEAINYGNAILNKNNIQNCGLDTELLLAKALGNNREKILINLNKKIEIKFLNKFIKLISRRKKNEPIAYILQKKEFWKNNFFINKDVLIPRPETELVIEETLKFVDINESKSFLDVGTGSGNITISLLKERLNLRATALDISRKAIKIAKFNAKMHHLENKINFLNIDIDKFNYNKYDFIVSNPPYIKELNLKNLEDNVRLFEPHVALEAGMDGFREIKKIIKKSRTLLKKNGKLVLEIGNKQDKLTKHLLTKNGYQINKIRKDFNSIPRVIVSTML